MLIIVGRIRSIDMLAWRGEGKASESQKSGRRSHPWRLTWNQLFFKITSSALPFICFLTLTMEHDANEATRLKPVGSKRGHSLALKDLSNATSSGAATITTQKKSRLVAPPQKENEPSPFNLSVAKQCLFGGSETSDKASVDQDGGEFCLG